MSDTGNPKTNYRLRDGDAVKLLEPARVDGYIPPSDAFSRGTWDLMYFLPGTTGKVIRARTPCVTARKGVGENTCCFANIDIDYMGSTYRVRVFHDTIRRIPTKKVTT